MNKRPFVLIVEDDARLRKVLAANLSEHGYMVMQADSYHQAIDLLAIKPQLLILDIGLPDASGWDVADWAGAVTAKVPTIIISGSRPDPRQMARLNPEAFLRKPFPIRHLMDLVTAHVPIPQ